jgi:hypothetical protein
VATDATKKLKEPVAYLLLAFTGLVALGSFIGLFVGDSFSAAALTVPANVSDVGVTALVVLAGLAIAVWLVTQGAERTPNARLVTLVALIITGVVTLISVIGTFALFAGPLEVSTKVLRFIYSVGGLAVLGVVALFILRAFQELPKPAKAIKAAGPHGQFAGQPHGQSFPQQGQPQFPQGQYGDQYGAGQFGQQQYGQYGDPQAHYGDPAAQAQYDAGQAQYGEPQPQYGEPQAQYGEPQAQYGEPQAQYGEAQAQYGEPQAQYGEAQAQYGEPQAQYGEAQAQYDAGQAQYGDPQAQGQYGEAAGQAHYGDAHAGQHDATAQYGSYGAGSAGGYEAAGHPQGDAAAAPSWGGQQYEAAGADKPVDEAANGVDDAAGTGWSAEGQQWGEQHTEQHTEQPQQQWGGQSDPWPPVQEPPAAEPQQGDTWRQQQGWGESDPDATVVERPAETEPKKDDGQQGWWSQPQ